MNFNNYKPIGKIPQKHMLSLNDYSREDIYEILKLAIKLKKERAEGIKHDIMKDKPLALIRSFFPQRIFNCREARAFTIRLWCSIEWVCRGL